MRSRDMYFLSNKQPKIWHDFENQWRKRKEAAI